VKCLETCDSLKASTIAFPALGAGTLNYPSKVVADIMASTVVSYLRTNSTLTCIKTVKLVIYTDIAYVQFNLALYELSLSSSMDEKLSRQIPHKKPYSFQSNSLQSNENEPEFVKTEEFVTADNRRIPNVKGNPRTSQNLSVLTSSWMHVSHSPDTSRPMSTKLVHSKSPILCVQIYAEISSNVKKTKDRLQRIIDDQFTTDVLTDELIVKLSNEKKSALMEKAKQSDVEITFKTSNPLLCIQLRGESNDIANLKFEILQELNHIRAFELFHREAKLLHSKLKWCWWRSDTKEYEEFDFLINYQIEQAYQSNKSSVTVVETNNLVVKCNFIKMEATINHSAHMIRRVDLLAYNGCYCKFVCVNL